MNALFLGYGRMGSAIGSAWQRAGLAGRVVAVDPYAVTDAGVAHYSSVDQVPAQAFEVILVAVKPGQVAETLAALPEALCRGAVVVSVAAGIGIDTLEGAVAGRCPVVRAMPNTPVLVGAGCTGLFAGAGLTEAQRELIGQLFEAVGTACWVDEEAQLDAVTAISGSGPAYYHLFSEALADAGVALGLSPELARQLATQTAFGAASLQRQPDADLTELRLAVTSPNGTTAAAIAVFEEHSALRRLCLDATEAAARRARELASGT